MSNSSMLSGMTNTFSFCCAGHVHRVTKMPSPLQASRSFSSVRRSVILVNSSVPSSSVMTFPACRISVIGWRPSVWAVLPCHISSKAAARSPWRVRGVFLRFVFSVSQFLRRDAREGLIEFFLRDLCRAGYGSRVSVVKSSLFLRQLNAFFQSGGFLRRYGSGCPGRCHLETALADDVRGVCVRCFLILSLLCHRTVQ